MVQRSRFEGEAMLLHHPLAISSRLMPGVKISDAWISLEPGGVREDRIQWTYYMDFRPTDGEPWSHEGSDLSSAPQYTDNEEGYRTSFSALLSFLSAAAESYPDGENADLFPPDVVEWARQNSDEISMIQSEIDGE